MEEDNNDYIISQPQKPYIVQWIGLIFFTYIFLSLLSLSIADASWAAFSITIIVFMSLVISMGFTMFFKKIYYLSVDKIIIADYKNEYITDLPFNEIHKWNHYSEKKDEYLVVSGQDTGIIIDKYNYKNFDELVAFFAKTNLVKDTSLKSSGIKNEATQKVATRTFYLYLSTAFMLSLLFWIITYSKSDSTEMQYFKGHIQTINTSSKSSTVRIELKEYPAISFRTEPEIVKKYRLRNKADLIEKTVRIGVFKSDYDWKIKNKRIRMLDMNSIPYLNAVSFEFTQK
ncbi:hypothetical protein [Runella sp.]|uniref:hypothetical protein n=1 Tax=Runella sp. TaxID=1960881 RepID=UPI003D1373E7